MIHFYAISSRFHSQCVFLAFLLIVTGECVTARGATTVQGDSVSTMIVTINPARLSKKSSALSDTQGRLVINIADFSNLKGMLRGALFDSKTGWPGEWTKHAVAKVDTPVLTRERILVFEGLPPGGYSFIAYHDLNNSGDLDTNLIRIPTEPVGISNNVTPRFGPPSFEDARVWVDVEETRIFIQMKE